MAHAMSHTFHDNVFISHFLGYDVSSFLSDKLVIAISSRALFNLNESHRVFVEEGVDAYCRYQIDREEVVLEAVSLSRW